MTEKDQAMVMVESESYAGRPIDRGVVVEFGDTLMGVHPGAKEIGIQGMRTIAQLALVTGANPLPGTNGIHAWRDKKGKLCFKFGIGYWRTQAELEGGVLWTDKPRPMTDSEREYYGIAKEQGASICSGALKKTVFDLMRESREFGFDLNLKEAKNEVSRIGVGVVNPNEYAKSGRPSQWSADKRAETDLLSQLVPAMSPALQVAQSGTSVKGGLDWSAGEFAHLQNGEGLPDDYGIEDANADLFDDETEVIDITPHTEPVDIEDGPVIEESESDAQPGPLLDDEQVIFEASATDFMVKVIALINRYSNAEHVKAVFKQLGYTGAPKGDGVDAKKKRLEMYRALKKQAAARDAEEAESKQAELTGAYAE